MNRRSFLALTSGLLVPMPERVRAYSFVGGWRAPSVIGAWTAPKPRPVAELAGEVIALIEKLQREGVIAAPGRGPQVMFSLGPGKVEVST